MTLKIQNGDYVTDGCGGLERMEGTQALLQRVLFRLKARRGQFPFLETLGSRLWQLGQVSGGQRQAAAEQYVAEALAEEPGVQVERVTIADSGSGGVTLTAELTWEGESLSVTAEIR